MCNLINTGKKFYIYFISLFHGVHVTNKILFIAISNILQEKNSKLC